MNVAPQLYIGFIGDTCVGAFVSGEAALAAVREQTYELPEHKGKGIHYKLFWSSWVEQRCTLHVSDQYSTRQDFVARVELVTLERRHPGDRRR